MGNTSKGARKAVRTKRAVYGHDVMERQGREGGKALWKKIRYGGIKTPLR